MMKCCELNTKSRFKTDKEQRKMDQERVCRELAALPPEAQQEVMDFIEFLSRRYKRAPVREKRRKPKMTEEAFVGMWRDRQDMEDSSDWVRGVRKREWTS